MSVAIVRQVARYGLIAGGVALLYLGVYGLGLALGLHYFVAIAAAQIVAISVAFPLYRTFVFESRGNLTSDFLRFLLVWSSGAVAGIVVTPLLVEIVHVPPFPAQVIAIVAVSVASFLAHRFFSFRRRAARAELGETVDS